jgi:hypothetical protein
MKYKYQGMGIEGLHEYAKQAKKSQLPYHHTIVFSLLFIQPLFPKKSP